MDRLPYYFLLFFTPHFLVKFVASPLCIKGLELKKIFASTFLVLNVLLLTAQSNGREYLHEIRQECDSLDCPEKYVRAYRLMAEDLGETFTNRLKYLKIAEQLSLEHADHFDILYIKAQEGKCYNEKGNNIEALRAFADGMKYLGLKDYSGYRSSEGWFLIGYGIVLYEVSLYEDALSIFNDCATLMAANEDWYGEAVALNNIGLCHANLGQNDSALSYFLRAYKTRKEQLDQNFLLAHSMIYIARVYKDLGYPAKADSCLSRAEFYSSSATNMEFFGQIYSEWAELNIDQKEYNKAKEFLNKAANMEHPFNDSFWVRLKIRYFFETNNYDSAVFYLDSALARVGRAGNIDKQFRYLKQKEKALRKMGFESKANELLQRVNDLGLRVVSMKDSLQMDLLKVQRAFVDYREELVNLEQETEEQKEIIASQNLTIVFITIVTLLSLIGFIVFYRLNNDLRRANQFNKILSKRTIAAAGALNNALIAIDENWQIDFFNPAAERYCESFLGFKLKRNKSFLDQFKSETQQLDWQKRLEQVSKIGNLQNISSQEFKGQVHYHVISMSKIETEGQAQGCVMVITDISESQRKSQELNRKSEALEKANEAKEKMLSLLAHDLKEGVLGSLELAKLSLEQEHSIEEHQSHLKLISESLAKTRTLLFKTLDWVKQQSDGLRLKKQNFYVDRLAKDLVKELESRAQGKAVEITNQIDENLQVNADPNVVRVVLRNLLNNALKYVQPTEGKIIIRSSVLKDQQIKISVKDNGMGMSGDQINQILSSKNTVSHKGTAGEEGTAIGLPLCQELLLNMNSSLQIDSALDQGSEFYFILPSHS